jgi:hypothetical protein
MKQAAMEAVKTSQPSNIVFGTVTSASPLKIQISSKITLEKEMLLLTRNVTEFETDITTVNWFTENTSGGAGYALFESHKHELKGKKHIIVHNQLRSGEKVVLIKEQGGQRYIVLDRVVSA